MDNDIWNRARTFDPDTSESDDTWSKRLMDFMTGQTHSVESVPVMLSDIFWRVSAQDV